MVSRVKPHAPSYSLEDVIQAVEAMAEDVQQLSTLAETSAVQRESTRHKAAVAVARSFLGGIGSRMFAAIVADKLPVTPRRVVNISEAWRVMKEHPKAKEIAEQWARGDFTTYKVAEALADTRPARTALDGVRSAVRRALREVSAEEVHAVVEEVAAEVPEDEGAEAGEEEAAAPPRRRTRA